MAWDRELEDFLTTTVVYAAPGTMDLGGAQTFSTATITIAARIEHDTRLVRDSIGREVVSQTQLFLKPTSTTGSTYALVVAGQITLPAGHEPLTPPIISVMRIGDVVSEGGGIHHWEVDL